MTRPGPCPAVRIDAIAAGQVWKSRASGSLIEITGETGTRISYEIVGTSTVLGMRRRGALTAISLCINYVLQEET